MVLGIDRDLHVVPDDAGTAPARRHRAGVRIGERDLLVGRSEHLFLDRREALHLTFEFREFLLETRRLERERLRRLLPIGRVELAEIARNAPFKRCPAPLHLTASDVPSAGVIGLKFTGSDAKPGLRQFVYLADELGG